MDSGSGDDVDDVGDVDTNGNGDENTTEMVIAKLIVAMM